MDPLITVRDLVFDYPGHRALDGVSFAIEAHTITALVGPNGAGKTTLLRCAAALDTPTAGHDPEARANLSAVLLGLRDDGLTIIVSSHILAELEDYSSHMLILRDGRVVEHRPIAAEVAGASVELVVVLAAPDPRLGELLAAAAGIADLRLTADGARVSFAGDLDGRRALLRPLV